MPKTTQSDQQEIMVVNDTPGEECRVAILQDGHLEELYTERTSSASLVGNIYKGKVINVEAAIQAAFIDFGHEKNGFLHISDLHPQYFPGQELKERVGKKIPRRQRPLMQQALRRGDEVLVQVLKEGMGTKGPTLTSYLSIPGRMLVMMPEMDRVGVSRKIEDEQKRREMRTILDSLDLPEGFGFILRTAGFERTRTDLKRDVQYLTRLWKVMDKRIKSIGAPCELYTESDLFIRTIRDVLRPNIAAIVVDSDSAFERAEMFLKVVAPRSAPKLIRYHPNVPIFHAFGIERQIELIHSRTVPLPSGGAIVIDQTEALVAIDVNSGRSRSARDGETNAFQTNCEAVDEICRQLRLRDMGGLIVNDIIDMRQHKHRRSIEERLRNNLKRDRAKTTALRLSEFSILEMTRQRMRPSLRMSHYVPCAACHGSGEVRSPDYVGADATRQLGFLLQHDRVHRVEMVCSPRVASVLLSSRRREMVRLEESSRKVIDVRVSENISADRVDFYIYDDRNVEISKDDLPETKMPSIAELEAMKPAAPIEDAPAAGRGRRKRNRKAPPADASTIALEEAREHDETDRAEAASKDDAPVSRGGKRRKKKTRRSAAPKVSRDTPAAPVEESAPEDKPVAPPARKRRVHHLARELGVPSKEIVARSAEDDRVEVKNHMSTVIGDAVSIIRSWFTSPTEVEKPKKADPKKTPRSKTQKTEAPEVSVNAEASESSETADGEGSKRRARRGKRGGRRRGRGKVESAPDSTTDSTINEALAPAEDKPKPPARKKRRSTRKTTASKKVASVSDTPAEAPKGQSDDETPRKKSSRRRGGRRRKAGASAEAKPSDNGEAPSPAADSKADDESKSTSPRRRRLYSSRVAVSPATRAEAEQSS